jgi:hypothetical protein
LMFLAVLGAINYSNFNYTALRLRAQPIEKEP